MLGYASSLVGATLKTVALQVATTALNAAITMGASLIVTGIITAISNWIRQDEILAEKAETAKQKIDELNNDYKEHSQLVSDSAKRYAELAQGVDQLSGKNLSLNDDDYKEFLDLSNQLAEAFPTLSRHYDENGNAILQLSGNVDTIVGSLNNLIEAERSLKNQEIADELPTVYKNANNKSDDYKKQIDELKEQRKTLIDSLGDVQSDDFSKNFIDGLEKSMISVEGENLETLSKMKDDYLKILKDANIDYEELTPDYENKDGVDVPVRFNIKINSSEKDIEKAKKTIKANVEDLASEYEGDISELNDKIQSVQDKNKANWSSLTGSIAAWLNTEDSYKIMSDDMQSTIQNIVNSLDWGELDFSSWEDAKQYIQDNILSLFQTSDGKDVLKKIEVMFGIQTQFNNGEITVNEYQEKLKTFLDEISTLAPDTQKAIKLIFGISTDEDGTTTSSVDTMVNNVKSKLKDEFDDKVGELSLDDLQVASKLEIPEGTLLSWDELKQKIEETKNAASEDTFELPDAETLKQQISDLNSAIDSIQSAYDTLNSAVEEYNTNGGTLSIDTIQSLLSLSDEYLACLQVENGQLSLNADAMAQLAQSKLDDAQATAVTQAMTELDTIAKGENSSANSAYISGNAALMSSLAQLSGSYEGVAKAAMTAAQAQRMSALISDAAGKDKTATENVMKGLDTKLKLIQTTKASINAGNFGKVAGKSSSSSKGSGSGKSASDTAKEEIEAYMEYLEKALEGGRITYSDYVRDVTLKLDDMYHNGRITAKEYFDYVEKRLNQQLEVYKSVLSAVTDLLEDEAQKWQDKIDALNDENDLLEKQKDDYDSILSAVDQVYQDEIDRLNEQKDLLQDKIDAINDENDALELQRKKQEALIALDKARQQRNVKIYTEDRGYFYSIDQDAYKDAQQNLQDIKNEEVIKKLEDEQDALDDSIELLEKYRDLWNDIADAYKKKTNEALAVALWGENYEKLILQNRTQDIEAFKDKYLEIQSKIDDNKSLIDSYQEKVDYYNKLKEQWSDISSAYEKEQQRMYAAQILGANWEKDVLDGRLDVLSQFRDQYLEIQRQMTQAALDGARARNDAAASGGTGGSGGSSGGGGGSTPIQNQQAYHVLHLVGGYSTSGEASSKISSFNGKGVYKYKDGKWYVYKEEDYSNLSFGSKSEADDYIKKHLSPAGKFLVKYYHNGLENGLVDFSKKDSNFDLVQKYGLKKYEVPAILKQGEAVMNQEQIKNLGEALRAIPTAATLYTTPDYTKMLSSLKTNNTPVMVTQSVNITLPNVTNNSGYENLTRELNRLKLDAYQFANRRN